MEKNKIAIMVMDFKSQIKEATETKCLQEILEEQRSIPYTILLPFVETPIKSGKQLMREIRAKERKTK